MRAIDRVMFSEYDGLNGRFRDTDYTVLPEEKKVIDDYIDEVISKSLKDGVVSVEDFRRILKIHNSLKITKYACSH